MINIALYNCDQSLPYDKECSPQKGIDYLYYNTTAIYAYILDTGLYP